MPRTGKKTDRTILKMAESELKKIPGSKEVIRLKAIIASERYPVKQVADIFSVSPRTLFRWINKFKSHGVAGLIDKPKGHQISKLSDIHKKKIENWIKKGRDSSGQRIRWTLWRLKAELEKVFKINISTTAIWNHLKKTGLSIKK